MANQKWEWSPWAPLPPSLDDGLPPGPRGDHQRLVKWYLYPEESHYHDVDYLLSIGAKGSGKSAAAAYTCIETALYCPGFQAIVGAKDGPQLDRTSKRLFRERFSIGEDEWNHPLVKHKPNEKDKRLILRTWNEQKRDWSGEPAHIWFIPFDDEKSLEGAQADMIIMEEPKNLRGRGPYLELAARLRNAAWKYKQMILCANPSEQRTWVDEEWKLFQFAPGYSGPPLEVGERCRCHLCDRCFLTGRGRFEYVDGFCPNPNCAAITAHHPGPGEKKTVCLGNQQYHRIIRSATFDNPAMSGAVIDSMLGTYDKVTAQINIHGKQIYTGEGKVYHSFEYYSNVAGGEGCHIKEEFELDPVRPVIWSLDWNVNPQCCAIIQEQTDAAGEYAVQLDEQVRWDTEPHEIAKVFADYLKARDFQSVVYIYGDPTGAGDKKTSKRSKFKIVMNVLKDESIEARICTKYEIEKICDSVQVTNACLRNARDEVRFFVNQRCLYTIKSFESVEWDKNGEWLINKTIDHNAYNQYQRQPEETRNSIVKLTHLTDAVRYYLMVRFKMWKDGTAPQFMQIPGEEVVQRVAGKTKVKDRRSKEKREAEQKGEAPKEKPKSLREMMKDMSEGQWAIGGSSMQDTAGGLTLFQ